MTPLENPAPQLSGNRGFENNSFGDEISNTLNQKSKNVNNADLNQLIPIDVVRQRADVLGHHPQATESISGLARVIQKTCERIPYDPDASFAAMLFFDRLERLAKREHFEPVIHHGAFAANRGRK